MAARINRGYSRGGWTPIRVEIEDNMDRAIAGYRNFDVLLVNPIYDGMNLVAKEGPLCNRRNGVLVLSENAGSHEELGDHVLTVNPFDIDETAAALYRGLMMDQRQRKARLTRIREIVRTSKTTLGIGLQGTLNTVPIALDPIYGSRTPVGGMVFVRIRPIHGPHMMPSAATR